MTKQEMNDIILKNIASEIADKPDVETRIAGAFKTWFQQKLSSDETTKTAEPEAAPPSEGAGAEPPPEGEPA